MWSAIELRSNEREPMFRLMRLVPIWLAAFIGLAQSSLAQSSNLSPHEVVPRLLQQTRVDDIAADPARIVVRASRLHSDGRIAPGLLIICDRSRPEHAYVAVQDYTLKTDDQHGIEPGFCDGLLALARQHQDAQQR
jgi:hypothetical protein